MNDYLLQVMVLGLAGFGAQWLAWKMRLPAIVFLLLTGFLFGPILHVIQPDALLGDLLRPAVSVAVAIILFEAALNLKFQEIREVRRAVYHIVLIGGPIAWLLTSMAGYYIGGLSLPTAVTFGGLLVVTGPTVIMPLLRSARLKPRTASILKWEGIVNDPLGVLFAIVAYEYFVHSGRHGGVDHTFWLQIAMVFAGVSAASVLLGLLTRYIFRRGWVPEYLKAYFLFITVIALSIVANIAMEEAGLLAVTVYGITLANCNLASMGEIRKFKESVTLLLVSGIFILLTADLDPAVLLDVDMRGVAFIACLLFLIRPLAVFVSTIGTGVTMRETALLAWVAPRGIVCAAISGVMGPLLVEAGYPDGAKLLPLAFSIVVITVVLHSLTVKPLGLRLGLTSKEAGGLIIAGASPWSIQLAALLNEKNVPVLIADTNWTSLKPARLASLPIYYGELLSEEAEFDLDLSLYGMLLAATANPAYNALVCNHFAGELGRDKVWQVPDVRHGGHERQHVTQMLQGRVFMDESQGYDTLWENHARGARFKATRIGPADTPGASAAILAMPNARRVGAIRGGSFRFSRPGSQSIIKEGDVLIWLELPAEIADSSVTDH